MAKIIVREPHPDDPIYKEGLQSFSRRLAQKSPASKPAAPDNTVGPPTPPPLSSKCSNVVHVDLDIDAARSRLLGNGPLVFDQAHGLFEPLGRHRFRAIKLEQM